MRVKDIDPTLTTRREVASKLRRTHGAIHYELKQFRLVSKLGQWVLHDLSYDQKNKHVNSNQQLFSLHRTNN